jgi:hypothetical protein
MGKFMLATSKEIASIPVFILIFFEGGKGKVIRME